MQYLKPDTLKNSVVFAAFAILLHLTHNDAVAQAAYYPRESWNREVNFHPDSILAEFPDHRAMVTFALRKYKRHNGFVKDFPGALREIIDVVRKGVADTLIPQRVQVEYKPEEQKDITLQQGSPVTTISTREKNIVKLLPPGWEMTIITKDVNVTVYAETFAALEALAREEYASLIASVDNAPGMATVGKKSIKARIVVKQHQVQQQKVTFNSPNDMIGLTASAGFGFVREKFYPELSGTVSLYFADHYQRLNHRIDLIYNAMFFTEKKTEGGYTANINSFLSVAYSHNWNRSTGRERWGGMGVGYLVGKQGDYFQGKTAKIFFTSDIGSTKLNIVPEFYLTDDFKKLAFGIKLNYTF